MLLHFEEMKKKKQRRYKVHLYAVVASVSIKLALHSIRQVICYFSVALLLRVSKNLYHKVLGYLTLP